jgi:hypothetical protein
MFGKLLLVSACVVGMVGVARAETWRMAPELVDQWSLFTCKASLPGRFWEFTLDGSRLTANGPDGVTWTTPVDAHGSFKVNFIGYFGEREQRYAVEMTGNVQADPKWALLHNIDYQCWYHLMPLPGF